MMAIALISAFLPWLNLNASPVPNKEDGGGRRNWVLEQLAIPPVSTFYGKERSQVSLEATHFTDSVGLQGSALLNLKYVELAGKFSQRVYPVLTDEGKALKESSFEEQKSASVELARNFITFTNNYGRIGAGMVQFMPREQRYFRFAINMGILETAETPYSLKIDITFFKKFQYQEYNVVGVHEEQNTWLLAGEIAKALKNEESSKWRVGGFFHWCYRQRSGFETLENLEYQKVPNTTGGPDPFLYNGHRFEHMLMSFGPFTEWYGGNYNLRVAANFRYLIDKVVSIERTVVIDEKGVPTQKNSTHASNPMEMRLPDLSLQFSYLF